MNIKFFLLMLLSSLYWAIPSYGADITHTYSWDSGEGSGVYYRVNNKDSLQNFFAEISHSKDGRQRLYFYKLDLDVFVVPENIKSLQDSNRMLSSFLKIDPTTTTMVFNGQAIKMTLFSEKYYKSQKSYSYFTPETEAGHTYLVNIFKKSNSPIKVEYKDLTLYIPSKGFTKKWNSNGGDAI